MPFALLLDDGTPCILSSGIDLGGRADGEGAVYGCGTETLSLGVVIPQGREPASAIDRSQPLWTVDVGRLGSADDAVGVPATALSDDCVIRSVVERPHNSGTEA
jgi:hypothetical protein